MCPPALPPPENITHVVTPQKGGIWFSTEHALLPRFSFSSNSILTREYISVSVVSVGGISLSLQLVEQKKVENNKKVGCVSSSSSSIFQG
jgi:hypothetical protein